jgi:tRNA 2-thiouridine synthesizing protein A
MDYNKEIDTRGLNCPLPILRAKKALAELETGQVLKVVATDPGSTRDFAAFSKQTGHMLLDSSEVNREFFFYLQKK